MQKLKVRTRSTKDVVDITYEIEALIRKEGFKDGLCHIFITHTTAALTTACLDPGTDLDLLDALTTIMPDLNYRHPHNPAHAPDHILGSLVGPSVTVPVADGRLVLGTWQSLVLLEFDGPRQRNLIVTLQG